MMFDALIMSHRRALEANLTAFIGVSIVLLPADMIALVWMTMWAAMSRRTPRAANLTVLAFGGVFALPWVLAFVFYPYTHWFLWLLVGLTVNVAVCRLARKRLRANFRRWAVPSYEPRLGFWVRLGRFLGKLQRKGQPLTTPA